MEVITYNDYWSEVESIAVQVTQESRTEDREIGEVLHETIDSHHWLIYNAYHLQILSISSKEDAYFDEHGGSLEVSSASEVFQTLAFYAFQADICAHTEFDSAEPFPASSGDGPKFATAAEAGAYDRGWNHGHGIACHNVPTIGATVRTEDSERIEVTADNIREIHASECHSAADNSRSYTPFEFTASEFNESDDSEALWSAFETGTGDAIAADLETYSDRDYGIEPNEPT